MPQILANPNEVILPCPHCKKNDKKITPVFMYSSKTYKCGNCEKEYTVEVLKIPGQTNAIVQVCAMVREDYSQEIFTINYRLGMIEQFVALCNAGV